MPWKSDSPAFGGAAGEGIGTGVGCFDMGAAGEGIGAGVGCRGVAGELNGVGRGGRVPGAGTNSAIVAIPWKSESPACGGADGGGVGAGVGMAAGVGWRVIGTGAEGTGVGCFGMAGAGAPAASPRVSVAGAGARKGAAEPSPDGGNSWISPVWYTGVPIEATGEPPAVVCGRSIISVPADWRSSPVAPALSSGLSRPTIWSNVSKPCSTRIRPRNRRGLPSRASASASLRYFSTCSWRRYPASTTR